MKTCIHTVIKNELDEYLKAWLDHHSKMVDQIFIFEDIDSHSHQRITSQYENVTLLSVFDMYSSEDKKQKLIDNKEKSGINQRFYITDGVSYIQALNKFDWCFTLDIDEFITLQAPYKAISDVLSEFNDYDAILLQWLNYGANGRVYKPNYNGIDYRKFYTKIGEQTTIDKERRLTTKICWNLNKITRWNLCGLHCCAGKWVMTNFKKDRKCICYDKMYLKHYVTRSWEEWVWKLYTRGMHCKDKHRKIDDFFEINPDMKPMKEELISLLENNNFKRLK